MRRSMLPCALVIAALALSGCGNKGPLFMPPPVAATKPVNAAAPKPVVQPAHTSTVGPAPVSTTFAPFNPIIHP